MNKAADKNTKENVYLAVQAADASSVRDAARLAAHLGLPLITGGESAAAREPLHEASNIPVYAGPAADFELILRFEQGCLSLEGDGLSMKADFLRMKKRVQPGKWEHELLVKAVRIHGHKTPLRVLDCTAGMGEDALILAAAGFEVSMFEKNPVIAALLQNELRQASRDPVLAQIVGRMTFQEGNSLPILQQITLGQRQRPDVIYLDPMFQKRTKSALIKKKFQLLHKMEQPCADEEELLEAAAAAHPKKIVIKRPAKGPYLAGIRPGYSISGKAIRFDCIVL